MYLLDTHVLSEIRKASRTKAASPRIDLHVHRWLKGVSALDLYVSVVTILELERGYHLLKDRDEPQAELIRSWIRDRVLPGFNGRILPVDLPVVLRCAGISPGKPIEYRDSLIAATALVHGMTVVTRNVRHFVASSATLLNPWEA